MRYVYLVKSIPYPKQHYVGVTKSVDERLKQNNQGISAHTAKFPPWKLVVLVGFVDEGAENEFEKYLESGSWREFARRYFRG